MQRTEIKTIVFSLLLLYTSFSLASWSGGKAWAEGKKLDFKTIDKGFRSGVTSPERLVIKDAQTWQDLWKRHSPMRPMPAVDFSTRMLIAVFAGEKATGGYAITIYKVAEEGKTITVHFHEISPPPDAIVVQVITQPYHIVEIEKTPLEIVFSQEGSSSKH